MVFVVAPANMSFVSLPSAIAHMFEPSGRQGGPSHRDFENARDALEAVVDDFTQSLRQVQSFV